MLTSYIIQRIISSYYMIYSIISCILNARELVHLHRMHERQNLPAHRATDAKHLDFGVLSYVLLSQGSLFTCIECMNDKIFQRIARQMRMHLDFGVII